MTLWRVTADLTRINRYIVGCKLYTPEMFGAKGDGINRYIVGCKYWKVDYGQSALQELIDT